MYRVMLYKKPLNAHLTTSIEISILAGLVSIPIIKANPLTKPLSYDGGVFVYLAQQIANGRAPYVAVFDHKTPLVGIFGAIFIEIGRLFNIYDLYAVRIGALLLAFIHVLLIYHLIKESTKSSTAAIIGAILLSGFSGYAEVNASWLDPKCILIVMQTALLLCILKDKYVIAGICSILAGLSWQPGFVSCIVGLLAIFIIFPGKQERRNNIKKYLGGIVLSLSIFLFYMCLKGALKDFLLQAFIFNITKYIPEKIPSSLFEQIHHIYDIMNRFYGPEIWEFQGALVLIPIFTFFSFKPFPRQEDAYIYRLKGIYISVISLTFIYIVLSLANFQGGPDLLPFLPQTVLIIVLTSHQIIISLNNLFIKSIASSNKYAEIDFKNILSVALVTLSLVISFRHITVECAHTTLQEQQNWVANQMAKSKNPVIQVVGAPEFLVLSNTQNANRFTYFYNGVVDFNVEEVSLIKYYFKKEGLPDMFVISRDGDDPFVEIINQNYKLTSQFHIKPDDDVDYALSCFPSQTLQTQVFSIR
jgi:hypothetical protein